MLHQFMKIIFQLAIVFVDLWGLNDQLCWVGYAHKRRLLLYIVILWNNNIGLFDHVSVDWNFFVGAQKKFWFYLVIEIIVQWFTNGQNTRVEITWVQVSAK